MGSWKDCNCTCHIEGTQELHCFPCCDKCYVKFLDKDGKRIMKSGHDGTLEKLDPAGKLASIVEEEK